MKSPGDEGCTDQITLGNKEGYTLEMESEKGTKIVRHPSFELTCRQLIDFRPEMDASLTRTATWGGLRLMQDPEGPNRGRGVGKRRGRLLGARWIQRGGGRKSSEFRASVVMETVLHQVQIEGLRERAGITGKWGRGPPTKSS